MVRPQRSSLQPQTSKEHLSKIPAQNKTAAREGLFLKRDHSEKSGAKSCPKASAQVVQGVGWGGGEKEGERCELKGEMCPDLLSSLRHAHF